MPHSVLAVANRFLERAIHDRVPLTPMHLQKLCYLAHGFSLAFSDSRLIEDQPEAWAYGPVYPRLYDAIKQFGSGAVTELIYENNWASSPSIRGEVVSEGFTRPEVDLISQVYENYAGFAAFKLSALTHEEGSPWTQIYNQGRMNAEIPDDLMRNYFRDLA